MEGGATEADVETELVEVDVPAVSESAEERA
jgi:hypothetical protein